jgi:hypothetical protein
MACLLLGWIAAVAKHCSGSLPCASPRIIEQRRKIDSSVLVLKLAQFHVETEATIL